MSNNICPRSKPLFEPFLGGADIWDIWDMESLLENVRPN
jgi:hypothetical protein